MPITEKMIKKDIDGYCISQFYTKEGLWSITEKYDMEGIYNGVLVNKNDILENIDTTIDKLLERINKGID